MAELDAEDVERGATRSGRLRRAPRLTQRTLLRPALFVSAVAALFLAWLIASHHYDAFIIPGPHPVWESFRSAWSRGVWGSEVESTLGHLFIAYGITVGIGLPIGIVIGRFWVVEDLSRALLIFLQTVPTIVLFVLALSFVGVSAKSVIGVTVASCLTYFTLTVIQGTKAIDRDLVEMARSYGASEATVMRKVILPSVVPYFLAGGRVTLGVAWQVTLFGEYLIGTPGMGFQVSAAIKLLDTAQVFMWGISVVVLTIVFEYGVYRPIEALLTRHTRGAD